MGGNCPSGLDENVQPEWSLERFGRPGKLCFADSTQPFQRRSPLQFASEAAWLEVFFGSMFLASVLFSWKPAACHC